MIKKYMTGYGNEIKPVECIRETKEFVYLPSMRASGERREGKSTEWAQYHDTWAEAHQYLIDKARSQVEVARLQLERAKANLGNVKGMRNPGEKP